MPHSTLSRTPSRAGRRAMSDATPETYECAGCAGETPTLDAVWIQGEPYCCRGCFAQRPSLEDARGGGRMRYFETMDERVMRMIWEACEEASLTSEWNAERVLREVRDSFHELDKQGREEENDD